jgi:hypothetical protein
VLQDLGQLEEARDLLRKAYSASTERYGPDHPSTRIFKGNLGALPGIQLLIEFDTLIWPTSMGHPFRLQRHTAVNILRTAAKIRLTAGRRYAHRSSGSGYANSIVESS